MAEIVFYVSKILELYALNWLGITFAFRATTARLLPDRPLQKSLLALLLAEKS